MTPRQLEKIGKNIWGVRWKSPLARALCMTYSHVNRYTTGEFEIPRRTDLAVRWLGEHPEEAEELGASARQLRSARGDVPRSVEV